MGHEVVIEGILQENRRLCQSQYDELVDRLLRIPEGSQRRQARGDAACIYLRRHVAGRGYEDVCVGPVVDKRVAALVGFLAERRAVVAAL